MLYDSKILTIIIQAVHCCLDLVAPREDDWLPECEKYFRNVVKDRLLNGYVNFKDRYVYIKHD